MFVWLATFEDLYNNQTVTFFHGSTKDKAIKSLLKWMFNSGFEWENYPKITEELQTKGRCRITDNLLEVRRFDYN